MPSTAHHQLTSRFLACMPCRWHCCWRRLPWNRCQEDRAGKQWRLQIANTFPVRRVCRLNSVTAQSRLRRCQPDSLCIGLIPPCLHTFLPRTLRMLACWSVQPLLKLFPWDRAGMLPPPDMQGKFRASTACIGYCLKDPGTCQASSRRTHFCLPKHSSENIFLGGIRCMTLSLHFLHSTPACKQSMKWRHPAVIHTPSGIWYMTWLHPRLQRKSLDCRGCTGELFCPQSTQPGRLLSTTPRCCFLCLVPREHART